MKFQGMSANRLQDHFLNQHMPGLTAYIRLKMGNRLRSRESAMDLAQSTCREFLDDFDKIEKPTETLWKQWLYITADRKIKNRARYWSRQKRNLKRDEISHTLSSAERRDLLRSYQTVFSPSQIVSGKEFVQQVEQAFALLPDDYREVIVLSRMMGLSHEEVGNKMQRSKDAVASLLYRALAKLASILHSQRVDYEHRRQSNH